MEQSIRTTHHATQTLALRVALLIAAALLGALLLGALLGSNWTLPMDPAIASAFTA